jgi:hypothetical protein
MKICSKKYYNGQKKLNGRNTLLAFTHSKKVEIRSFIRARIRIRSQATRSGSDQKRLDLTGSGSATLACSYTMLYASKCNIGYELAYIIDICGGTIREEARWPGGQVPVPYLEHTLVPVPIWFR